MTFIDEMVARVSERGENKIKQSRDVGYIQFWWIGCRHLYVSEITRAWVSSFNRLLYVYST
jgi:hypothetical protein